MCPSDDDWDIEYTEDGDVLHVRFSIQVGRGKKGRKAHSTALLAVRKALASVPGIKPVSARRCRHCHDPLPASAPAKRQYCSDRCKVAWHYHNRGA